MAEAHRYPKKELTTDFLRGGVGFAIVAMPLASVPMLSTFQFIFGGVAILFGGYILRTWQRAVSRVEADDQGIAIVGPLGRAIAWGSLDLVTLKYYTVKRSRLVPSRAEMERGEQEREHKPKDDGWMQLVLRGGGSKIAIDSTIDDFRRLLDYTAEAVHANDLALSDVTVENFAAAGIEGLKRATERVEIRPPEEG
ncbi:MAG: hypothetical protein HOL85_17890 [Rhodospirillaceae bacterium]|nr:hypothetical protein [Rhodospirillaceae bacterium]MBT6138876.1 hypothetical protein [Rhodospirillaceae bacterium]